MSYRILGYAARKPTLSPAQFRDHYDNKHIPLLLAFTGDLFPKTHTRYYLSRVPKDSASLDISNTNHLATVYGGKPEDFDDFDVFVELVFESVEKWEAFAKRLGEVTAAPDGIFHADELAFLDLNKRKLVVVGDPVVTVAPKWVKWRGFDAAETCWVENI